jgi:hypothetical protein
VKKGLEGPSFGTDAAEVKRLHFFLRFWQLFGFSSLSGKEKSTKV